MPEVEVVVATTGGPRPRSTASRGSTTPPVGFAIRSISSHVSQPTSPTQISLVVGRNVNRNGLRIAVRDDPPRVASGDARFGLPAIAAPVVGSRRRIAPSRVAGSDGGVRRWTPRRDANTSGASARTVARTRRAARLRSARRPDQNSARSRRPRPRRWPRPRLGADRSCVGPAADREWDGHRPARIGHRSGRLLDPVEVDGRGPAARVDVPTRWCQPVSPAGVHLKWALPFSV